MQTTRCSRSQSLTYPAPLQPTIATTSSYFFVRGQIRLARADIRMEALVRRSAQAGGGPVEVLWQREL